MLKLAHEVPLSGHLGKEKTSRRVLQWFYWPTLYRDVSKLCKMCDTCQKASWYKGKQAPLIPLPIIDVPFKRIAMSIVGPYHAVNQAINIFWWFAIMPLDTLKR